MGPRLGLGLALLALPLLLVTACGGGGSSGASSGQSRSSSADSQVPTSAPSTSPTIDFFNLQVGECFAGIPESLGTSTSTPVSASTCDLAHTGEVIALQPNLKCPDSLAVALGGSIGGSTPQLDASIPRDLVAQQRGGPPRGFCLIYSRSGQSYTGTLKSHVAP